VGISRELWWIRTMIQAVNGLAEEESCIRILPTTTTRRVVVRALERAARGPRDMP